MSGGSMEYLYQKVEEAQFLATTPLRRAFRTHLNKVAAALKAIEWNDSYDGDDEEDQKIRNCLGECALLEEVTLEARVALENLRKALGDSEL